MNCRADRRATLPLTALFGDVGHPGALPPGHGISSVTALVSGSLLTLRLVNVLLGTRAASPQRCVNATLETEVTSRSRSRLRSKQQGPR